jgi:oligopeptide/dipeptide ABC transporter ATP-binding protein
MTGEDILLDVRDLRTVFHTPSGPLRAVDGVSFQVNPGERLGIVGESGSGKSVTALSILGLVPAGRASVSGEARFGGIDLLSVARSKLRPIRGARIGMIFQNPLDSLDPTMTIGRQIEEAILAHQHLSRRLARDRAVDLLGQVGIASPRRSADEYPHRFSGGMRQRVMIAMALSCGPDLVIADEPTTALDVTIQAQIIELLDSLCRDRGTAIILITHDLALLAGFADRILVMYAGRVVEQAPVDTIYYRPAHPYTWGLMTAVARVDQPRTERMTAIRGTPPSGLSVPPGCAYHPRCPHARDVCRTEEPELRPLAELDHRAACHFAGDLSPTALAPGAGS